MPIWMLLSLTLATADELAAGPNLSASAISQLQTSLDVQADAAAWYGDWARRPDLHPDQGACLAAPTASLTEQVTRARAAEETWRLAATDKAAEEALTVLVEAHSRIAPLLARARACMSCDDVPADTTSCKDVPRLDLLNNEVRGFRWQSECSASSDWVCRPVGSACPCTEATVEDWLGG